MPSIFLAFHLGMWSLSPTAVSTMMTFAMLWCSHKNPHYNKRQFESNCVINEPLFFFSCLFVSFLSISWTLSKHFPHSVFIILGVYTLLSIFLGPVFEFILYHEGCSDSHYNLSYFSSKWDHWAGTLSHSVFIIWERFLFTFLIILKRHFIQIILIAF